MGYNIFEVRGSEVYPYISDDFPDFMPVFEIRGSEVYPTVYNERDDIWRPMFEIRDGHAYPTAFNDHDDDGFDVPDDDEDDGDEDDDSGDVDHYSGPSATAGDLAALAVVGVGLVAAVKMWTSGRDRRERTAAFRSLQWGTPSRSQDQAPPGWYPTPDGLRYWNGVAWTWHQPPRTQSGHHPRRPGSAMKVVAWVMAALTWGYMLPWAVAVTRGSSNRTAVGLVCFFLGWTLIGWLVALAMACVAQPVRPVYRA